MRAFDHVRRYRVRGCLRSRRLGNVFRGGGGHCHIGFRHRRIFSGGGGHRGLCLRRRFLRGGGLWRFRLLRRLRFFLALGLRFGDGALFEKIHYLLRVFFPPPLHHFRVVQQLYAGAVFVLGFARAFGAQHLLDFDVVAVVVWGGEQLAGETAARHGGEVAGWRLDILFFGIKIVAEVRRHQVCAGFRLGCREPAARFALVEALLFVFRVEFESDIGRFWVFEEELDEVSQRYCAVAGLYLARY